MYQKLKYECFCLAIYEACPESNDTSHVGKLFKLIMATLPLTLILYLWTVLVWRW